MKSRDNKRSAGISVASMVLGLLAAFMLCSTMGCVHRQKSDMLTFQFKPGDTANNGQPVYVVIRKVDQRQFILQSYEDIAHMVYEGSSDKGLLAWYMLLPGKNEKIKIVKPGNSAIGVYALFTKPGEHWKVMLDKPLGSKYKFMLNGNVLSSKNK